MCPWVADSSFPLYLCRQTQAKAWQRCYRTHSCVQKKCVHKRLVGPLWALAWLLHSFTTDNVGVELTMCRFPIYSITYLLTTWWSNFRRYFPISKKLPSLEGVRDALQDLEGVWMLSKAQPLFPILAVSFSFLLLVPWQRRKAESNSRITNVSWNSLPGTKISPETFLVCFFLTKKGFYLFIFFNRKRCINTLKSRGASLRKGRNLISPSWEVRKRKEERFSSS